MRLATVQDVAAITALMTASARELSEPFYDARQTASIERHVATVDLQLITDGTYYVIEDPTEQLAACGGWSRRDKRYHGNADAGTSRLLDPATEPARVRAMYVHPAHARRGLGRAILERSEQDARDAGFATAELVATLPGERLYLACGYTVLERVSVPLPDGVEIACARMTKRIAS